MSQAAFERGDWAAVIEAHPLESHDPAEWLRYGVALLLTLRPGADAAQQQQQAALAFVQAEREGASRESVINAYSIAVKINLYNAVSQAGIQIDETSNGSGLKESLSYLQGKVIVVAGMRHSGSTALFNMLRFMLIDGGLEVDPMYSEYGKAVESVEPSPGRVRLLKTHEYRDDVKSCAYMVFTTCRDLRDSVASGQRRGFSLLAKIGGPVEYAKYNRSLHAIWRPFSSYQFRYEDFIQAPAGVVLDVLRVLGHGGHVDDVYLAELVRKVQNLPQDRYEETLLSPSHITDPERVLSYRLTLGADDIRLINSQNKEWLLDFNYPL